MTLKIKWTREVITDSDCGRPDDNDCGFWPSLDPEEAGYIGANPERSYEEQMTAAEERMAAFNAGEWGYIGVRAKAEIWIPIGSGCYRIMELESAGLWGIESDSDSEYLESVYADERAALLDELKTLGRLLAAGEVEEESK